MRLIDADALKKRLIKRRDQIAEERRYGWEFEYNGFNGAVLLTGCEAAQHCIEPMPHWIPCSERLPEESGRYIVSVLDGIDRRTTVAPYQPRCKAWTMTGRMAYWKVTAWMPLPEPYEGQK